MIFLVFTLVLRRPRQADAREVNESLPPRWDIPLRMVIATIFVVLITALAPAFRRPSHRTAGPVSTFHRHAGSVRTSPVWAGRGHEGTARAS